MTFRIGPGPVFLYECLALARRWQTYVARSGFVVILLISLLTVWWNTQQDLQVRGVSVRAQAEIGVNFYYGIIGTELSLVLLAAPAMTAGAICIDKARGTLTHMLVTDLSSAEIVFGKLLSRLVPVLGLVLCGVPVMFMASLLGGIEPQALLGATLILLGVGTLTCAIALALSVWGTKTHEILLATYVILVVLLLLHPVWMTIDTMLARLLIRPTMPTWVIKTNPFYLAFAVYLTPEWYSASSGRTYLQDAVIFLGVTVGLTLLVVTWCAFRIRAVVRRQAGLPQRRSRWRLPRLRFLKPSLDWNPVLWREWHRKRSSLWSAFIWLTFWVGSIAFTILVIFTYGWSGRGFNELGPFVSAFQVSIGMLLAMVYAVTSLSEERTRGSLDLLMVTPLRTSTIVWGKWWASFRSAFPLVILPTINVIAVCFSRDWRCLPLAFAMFVMVTSYAILWTSVGLALATWVKRFGWAVATSVAVYLVVAVGVFIGAMLLFRHEVGRAIACFSPFFGPGELTASAEHLANREWTSYYLVAIVNTMAGVTIYFLTLITFNACLGRMTSMIPRRFPPPRRPTQRPQMAAAS
jgi:ABC-type transport system involved in multi-copper enzyme maturation permease subunit